MFRAPIPRRGAPLVLALTLVLSVLGWFPPARGDSVPPTVARWVKVEPRAVLGPGRFGLSLAPGGVLRATAPVRTAETRLCAPIWFTGVGLTWEQVGGGDVDAHIRAGDSRASLGSAVEVGTEPQEGPDPGSVEYHPGRRTTRFLWTGESRCIGFSLELPAGTAMEDVQAVFVNTSGTADGSTTSPLGAVTGFLGRVLSVPAAEATTGRPAMVPRWKWGADKSLLNCDPGVAPELKMAFVHHTAGSNDYSPSESDDVMRGILYFHTQVNGWCDIAYNFLVDRFGTIFIGRAGGAKLPVIPAATQGFNTGSFAVAAMGNFQEVPVPAATLSAVERVLAWRLDVAHLPADGWATMISGGGDHTRYEQGTRVTMNLISGHRRTGLTSCPGTYLNALLPRIREDVARIGLPKILRPAQTVDAITQGTGETVRFTARGTEPLSWQVDVLDAVKSVVRSFTAFGPSLDLTWDGLLPDGTPAPAGDYTVLIAGTSPGGRTARSARFTISVLAPPPPSPSPSPTPTPSETPSETPSASPTP